MRLLSVLLIALPGPALTADLAFCWFGANGYVIDGRMSLPDAALDQPLVTEADVTTFVITGYHNGKPLGRWSLAQLTPRTGWNLSFDPAAMAFVTGGHSMTDEGQTWNATGMVDDCGVPGFGFNSGRGGQDVCVDGQWRIDSMIAADAPFPVYFADEAPNCLSAPVLSAAPHRPDAAS